MFSAARERIASIPGVDVELKDRLRELLDLVRPVFALVLLLMLIDRVVLRVTDLGTGYDSPVLVIEMLRQRPLEFGVTAIATVAVIVRARSLGPDWPKLRASLRVPIGAVIVVMTWAFACYEYNLYFDRLHLADRLLLIACAALALWRPLFVAPWVAVVMMLAQQFHYPIGGWTMAEPLQLVRVTELFVALLIIRLVTRRWYSVEFLFVALALVASAYWVSGRGKIGLGWLTVGPHLESLLMATYANGWLGFLSPDSISGLGRFLAAVGWPLLLLGIVVELGAIALLWRRTTLITWLMLFIVFHLGVFALTGIFFWKWIVFEVVLLVYLLWQRAIDELPIFDLSHAVIGTLLILLAPIWARPVDLSWLDAPVSYVYRLEATNENGVKTTLSPEFFRPYDYHFTLSAFGYLSTEPTLPIVWGAIRDRPLVESLYEAADADEVFAIERDFGLEQFDEFRAGRFDEFIVVFVGNWNRRRSHTSWLSTVQAPPQLWTSGVDDPDGRIVEVSVVQVTTFWDGNEYREIRAVPIRNVSIAP